MLIRNDERLKVSIIILREKVPFQKLGHIYSLYMYTYYLVVMKTKITEAVILVLIIHKLCNHNHGKKLQYQHIEHKQL